MIRGPRAIAFRHHNHSRISMVVPGREGGEGVGGFPGLAGGSVPDTDRYLGQLLCHSGVAVALGPRRAVKIYSSNSSA
jgi:hypothetical protein